MKKRVYNKEFKIRAIQLAEKRGSVEDASSELDIPSGNLYKWKRQYPEYSAKPDQKKVAQKATLEALEEENKRLQKKLQEKEDIILVLKSATIFFCQDQKKSDLKPFSKIKKDFTI